MNPLPLRIAAVAFALSVLCSGCTSHEDTSQDDSAVRVVTTTTILVDFVRAVGGAHVSVRSIVPIGASVEEYEPTPQDVAAVHDARLLVENGAGLETWLGGLIDNAKSPNLTMIIASQGLPLINHNPHLWMDPIAVETYVAHIRDGLIAVDPTHADDYQRNARNYDAKLLALTAVVRSKLAVIPKERRVMIVYHDAWRYYDRRFGLQTAGVIELAPGRESGAAEIARLVDIARASGISVIFSEPEESSRLADALASSLPHGTVVPLSVDTVGATPAIGTYLNLINDDTDKIVSALK